MASDNREQQFERALARLLRDASPESHCPDAEILSAYHERTLPSEEMSRWKEHISGCVPCQEVLALVERSENVQTQEWELEQQPAAMFETAPVASTHQIFAKAPAQTAAAAVQQTAEMPSRVVSMRPRWRWLAPIGAVAAALIAWVGVHEIRNQKRETATIEMARRQEPPLSMVSPSTIPDRTDNLKKDAVPSHALDESRSEASKVAPTPPGPAPAVPESNYARKKAPSSAPAVGIPEGALNKPMLEKDREAKVGGVAGALLPGTAPTQGDALQNRDVQQNAQNMQQNTQQNAQSYSLGGAVGGAPAPQKKQKAAEVPAASQSVAVEPSAPVPAAEEVSVLQSSQMNLLAAAAADHRYIVAPGEKSAWRVGDAGKIERSTDHGRTWKLENSAVTADLTAGSATSDKVCWIVGKSGTILLSTDSGKHWKQLTSPIDSDLGGIHAVDASSASVWDVPNRNSFETHDGGATWVRSGNE